MVTERVRKGKKRDVLYYDVRFNAKGENYENIKNFLFLYGDDVLKRMFFTTVSKCVDKRELLEYLLFDEVDDFICNRSKINGMV